VVQWLVQFGGSKWSLRYTDDICIHTRTLKPNEYTMPGARLRTLESVVYLASTSVIQQCSPPKPAPSPAQSIDVRCKNHIDKQTVYNCLARAKDICRDVIYLIYTVQTPKGIRLLICAIYHQVGILTSIFKELDYYWRIQMFVCRLLKILCSLLLTASLQNSWLNFV
jgi:hypothetical protein